MPELSVIIAAYNAGASLEACLRSIRNSSWTDYELIVVDDGSRDNTGSLARQYADRVVRHAENRGRFLARQAGLREARSPILVNIDSDVMVFPDTLQKIHDFFSVHPQAVALTGLLSKENPYTNYLSQYKNLYMHYRFRGLPETVTFLYGSLFAVRRLWAASFNPKVEIADDTAWGQELVRQGHRIYFSRDLAVIHLKRYNFRSWLKNDFRIPYDWARIFWRYRGWKQLGKNRTGFAHASLGQIASLFLAPGFLLLPVLLRNLSSWSVPLDFSLGLAWVLLNSKFIFFLSEERGFLFAMKGIFVTFLDHLVMGAGVFMGFLSSWVLRTRSS
jgi:glycosyltransferase involved in cell wall biosynthesis